MSHPSHTAPAPRSQPTRPVVGLSFDDGPDPVWTPRILRALADAGVRATFFVMSPRAARHPELLAKMAAAGHEIGLHCARHLRHTTTARPVIEDDTDRALATLATLDVRPTRWRVPWGAGADWTPAVARAHGLELIGWSADTHDWRGDPGPTMLRAIEGRLVPGAVVLMHDGLGPGARRDGCLETLRLIGPLASVLRDRGLAGAALAGMGTPCT